MNSNEMTTGVFLMGALVILYLIMAAVSILYPPYETANVQPQDVLKAALDAGYDIERNSVHLYRRGSVLTVLKFNTKDVEVDETFTDDVKAIGRFLQLAPPKVGN